MKTERNGRGPIGSALNFGARTALGPKMPALSTARLEVADAPSKTQRADRGNDPYNTSGSFDRTQNWTRVSKR